MKFSRFLKSKYYNPHNIKGYDVRAKIAVGLHGIETNWYKATLIPSDGKSLDKRCKVYHLPNNYINDEQWCNIKFDEIVIL